jgi:hypothetical protein
MNTARTVSSVLIAAAVCTGCHRASVDDVSYPAIAHNLSPELMGTVERDVDVNRNINVTADVNSRMFYDDIGRAIYTDHPSRLSPLPITGTSGLPK